MTRAARLATWLLVALGSAGASAAASSDLVLHATDIATLSGDWTRAQLGGAAGGQAVTSGDQGWSQTDSALAAPTKFVEATFAAEANVTYRVWLRLRAADRLQVQRLGLGAVLERRRYERLAAVPDRLHKRAPR